MKLWILKPIDEKSRVTTEGLSVKRWTWDCAWGFVVRALTEQAARRKAADESGDEGRDAWLDTELTTCVELTNEGDPGVVMKDFLSG